MDRWGNRAVLRTSPMPTSFSIPVLFAARVAEDTPVAVICEGRSLTYRELDESSNGFAHLLLLGEGAGPGGAVVALLLPRWPRPLWRFWRC